MANSSQEPGQGVTIHPTRPKKTIKIIILISVGILIGILLCMGSVAILTISSLCKIMAEKAPIESVLDSFMESMEANDVDSAYTLFSPHSKQHSSVEELEKSFKGDGFELFEGYDDLSIRSFNMPMDEDSDFDAPQGITVTYTGEISYEDGSTGNLEANLEKIDGTWKILNINISKLPD